MEPIDQVGIHSPRVTLGKDPEPEGAGERIKGASFHLSHLGEDLGRSNSEGTGCGKDQKQ